MTPVDLTPAALRPAVMIVHETTVGEQPGLRDLWFELRARDTSVLRGRNPRELLDGIAAAASEAAEEDWNGEGGQPVEGSTVAWAEEFAALLPFTLPLPEVSADSDGDLGFEWYFAPDPVVTASVRRDGAVCYAALVKTSRAQGWASLSAGFPVEITDWVGRAFTA
jgi:hypothetical protein